MAPFADVLFAMDHCWWKAYGNEVDGDFELWTSSLQASRIWGLNWIRSEQGGGVSQRRDTIRHGGNSGFQAVSLALYFGAAQVVLLGYDMQFTGGRTHWHGDHIAGLGNPIEKKMRDWHGRFSALAGVAPGRIVNATRETALRCFPKVDLLESLAEPAALGS